MSFVDKLEKTKKVYIPRTPLNRPLREDGPIGDIGLELEIEGQGLPVGPGLLRHTSPSGTHWDVHNDGSLRGGVEYVLSAATPVAEIPGLLDHLFKNLSAENVRINNSNRCSTHVHVNVSGMKVSQLTSFIALWGLFEQAAVRFCGPLRKTNQFCLTSKDTNGWLPEIWLQCLQDGRFQFPNDYKYSSLNLGAFSRFGSFEFRTMAGADPSMRDDLVGWVRFLYGLREYSKRILPDELAFAVSEKSPSGILTEIAKEFDVSILPALLYDDLDRDALSSFRDFQAICFYLPWSDLRKEIEKKYLRNPFLRSREIAR